MQKTSPMFQNLTNFTLKEFDELAALFYPTLAQNVGTTKETHLK
jgi:hypothetical protein